MKRIILKKGEEQRIRQGHPWVFDNEIECILGPSGPAELTPGETADVESSRKEYLGRALVNPASKITARIYSPSKEGMDKGFFKRRIRQAIGRRSSFNLERESCRIVFGEADFLPALIADRFVGWPLEDLCSALEERPLSFDAAQAALGRPKSWLSIQLLCFGMDLRREEIIRAFAEVWEQAAREEEAMPALEGIVERSEAKVRELEGLQSRSGLAWGTLPAQGIVIFENGFPFAVNLEGGQKTGHFLDQSENRMRAASFAEGQEVLDLCCNTGGFSIHAARCGALSVQAADVSSQCLDMVKTNARLNGVSEGIETLEADVFELLRSYERGKRRFGLIILDPPAFAKSRSALDGAVRGYKEINLRSMKLLKPGGMLVSCSCSQVMEEEGFKKMIKAAAADAGRRAVQVDFRCQAKDHPILVGYGESHYLKCGYYQIL